MEEQELRNFLRSEGEELTEVAVPAIDLNEGCLADISDGIESDGLDVLVKNLGTVANAFKTENDFSCDTEVLTEAVKVIHTALMRAYMGITAAQENVKSSLENLDRQTKHKYRKYLAVIFFLINKAFTEIERGVTAEAHNISVQMAAKDTGKKRAKKQTDETVDSKYNFWNFWRPRIIQQLWKIICPPMDEIWGGNVIEGYNVMRCLTLALYTTIKNKTKRVRTADPELDDIFDILGILASCHQEEKGILSRLIPLIKGSEETAIMVAGGIDRMIKLGPSNKAANIVMQSLNEAVDIYTTRFDKDSGQERGFHAFLTQLCALQPNGAMQSLAIIVQFLEADSQIVRNAILVVATELMNWTWQQMSTEDTSNRNNDEEEMGDDRPSHLNSNWIAKREKLLDEILLLHMKDTNSLVRSKAINLLAELVEKKMLIPAEAVQVMKNVKNRLLDKTVTTRKAATNMVIDLVKSYPHMVSNTADSFEAKRMQKLDEIVAVIQKDERNSGVALYFIIKEFQLYVKNNYTISPAVTEKIKSAPSVNEVMEYLGELLKERKYWMACEALYYSLKRFAKDPEFQQLMAHLSDGDESNLYLIFFKTTYPDIFPEKDVDSLDVAERNYIAPKAVEERREFLKFLQCCYKMHLELQECHPSLKKLLELGTTTDKKEAVLFFAALSENGYKASNDITASIINALDQLTADELPDFVAPFKSVFIGHNSGPVGTVKQLLQLVKRIPENYVENLSGMIGELHRSHCLTGESIAVLWDAYCLSPPGTWEPEDSSSACHILGIISRYQKQIVTTNLAKLIEVGLGQRGIEDSQLAKVTLQTILYGCKLEPEFVVPEMPAPGVRGKKVNKAPTKRSSAEAIKFSPDHELFPRLIALIENGLSTEGSPKKDADFPKVAEVSFQIIYRMCTEPNDIVSKILPKIHGLIFSSATTQQSQPDPFKTSEKLLFRYMTFGKALLGAHIAFYEKTVTNEIKQRKALLDKAKKNKSKSNSNRVRGSTSRSNLSTSSNSTNSSIMNQSNQDAAAAEMDVMIGNIGFDAEADNIKNYVGKLLDGGFFRQFRVHVLCLVNTFNTIKSLNLKVAIVQALGKLMLVCEPSVIKTIDSLVNLWKGNEPFPVKMEILKASVQLTIKFPNQMEKMNDCFSKGLLDKDFQVRIACMDYIQYLALSDLLKIKEQLSDTAACLCDSKFELREMAKDFINQIAEKDNVLQNTIPDIISRLSTKVSQENFQNIMKMLLTKIKKEKQLGGLTDRIVARFKGPVSVRVCQDAAFCLTQVQHNEKTLKILKDQISCYGDKLGDDMVWEWFMELLQIFSKLNKSELKIKLDEWEKDLQDNRAKCVQLKKAAEASKKKNEKQVLLDPESSEEEENNEDGNAENMETDGVNGAEGAEENEEDDEAEESNNIKREGRRPSKKVNKSPPSRDSKITRKSTRSRRVASSDEEEEMDEDSGGSDDNNEEEPMEQSQSSENEEEGDAQMNVVSESEEEEEDDGDE